MITPNRLTILRILIAIASPILLIWKRSFEIDLIVTSAFVVACVTDWWDGYLARTKSMITQAGKIIDPIADKLLILGLMFTFSFQGLYALEWVLPIAVREISVTWVRLIHLKQGRVMSAEFAGKLKVGFQIGSVSATLLLMMIIDSGLFFRLHSVILRGLFLIHYLGIFFANIFTIASGIIFFKRLEPPKPF